MYTDKPCTEIHDYCHMTLDSYTLAWYKRVTEKRDLTLGARSTIIMNTF